MVEREQHPAPGDTVRSLPKIPRRLSLPPGVPLTQGIITAFRQITAYAQHCASMAEDRPRFAVHEFRKSVRRARAVVRLVESLVESDVLGELHDVLRTAQRATSAQRDHDVLPHVLRRLALAPEVGAAIAVRLQSRRTDGDLAPIASVLAQHAAAMLPLGDVLAAAMPDRVRWRDVTRGIRRTYRRAQRTQSRGKLSESQLHRWRNRNKELRYQLELLAIPGAERVRNLRRAHAGLSEQLGDIVDLIVVRDRLRESAGPTARAALAAANDELDRAIRRARSRGNTLYATKSRPFAAAVAKSARAARNAAETS